MSSYKLTIALSIFLVTFGCSPVAVTPDIRTNLPEANVTATPLPAPSATLEPDFPEGCINLTETPLNTASLNGLFVIYDSGNRKVYFSNPKSNQLLDIEKQIQISWNSPDTDVKFTRVSPNKKFIQAHLKGKNYDIVSTLDGVIKTYDTQGQEDWNRGRWLDNERMFFQNWFDAPYGIYTIVIYNPFTSEQKNMQLDLPNPYIVKDTGGRVSWVKADIDPTLKRVLYNDEDERLVLWDLGTQKEIAFLPSPTDLIEGIWSPDGKEFVIPSPSQTSDISVASELFTIDIDGIVKKMTNFNQKYPFANVDIWPSWSPDGHRIAYWLKISNAANVDPETLRQWLAITDTTTLDTQIYCLSPNKPPISGGGIVWSPDSQQIIINTNILSGEVIPVLVNLTQLTQTALDTHGLRVIDWMAP